MMFSWLKLLVAFSMSSIVRSLISLVLLGKIMTRLASLPTSLELEEKECNSLANLSVSPPGNIFLLETIQYTKITRIPEMTKQTPRGIPKKSRLFRSLVWAE
uniref:Uncharacterized protein n=1 Tax=Opuntia streptacantha TaxID=393608 RepID=A0A7C8ZPY1_OPUST